jgi:hypothetical protein
MFCSSTIKPQSRQSARLFLQLSALGLSPSPSPEGEFAPPWFLGEGHTRLRERGWGSQFKRGDRHWGTLGILYMYLVYKTQGAYQAGIEMPSTRNRCSTYYDFKRKPEMRGNIILILGILTPVPAHLSPDHRGEKRPKHSLSSLEVYSRICSEALFLVQPPRPLYADSVCDGGV